MESESEEEFGGEGGRGPGEDGENDGIDIDGLEIGSKKDESALFITGFFFLLFVFPIALGLFGFPINLYLGVSVAIHEIGHLIFGIIGGMLGLGNLLGVAGGTIFEYANPVLAVVIFARNRRSAALAMVFLACLGSIMPSTADYMETASYPYGTSYFGKLTGRPNDMSPASHDWTIILSAFGMLGSEWTIGSYLRAAGEAIALVGLMGSFIGLWLLMNKSPAGFPQLLLFGSLAPLAYFIFEGALLQAAVCGVLFLLGGGVVLVRARPRKIGKTKNRG